MSTLLEHLNDLKMFSGEDTKKLWSSAGTVLVVNMVATHLDELIALASESKESATLVPVKDYVDLPDFDSLSAPPAPSAVVVNDYDASVDRPDASVEVEKVIEAAAQITEAAGGENSAVRALLKSRAALIRALDRSQPEPQAMSAEPIMHFALAVLEESRDSLADLDGGWLQDKAEEYGLLVRIAVDKPCHEDACQCAEYGDFPQECLRYSEQVKTMLDR